MKKYFFRAMFVFLIAGFMPFVVSAQEATEDTTTPEETLTSETTSETVSTEATTKSDSVLRQERLVRMIQLGASQNKRANMFQARIDKKNATIRKTEEKKALIQDIKKTMNEELRKIQKPTHENLNSTRKLTVFKGGAIKRSSTATITKKSTTPRTRTIRLLHPPVISDTETTEIIETTETTNDSEGTENTETTPEE